MDQGWAIVLAALITLAGVVLVAVVGLGGVVVGGRISGNAARDTAKSSADAARESAAIAKETADADREEARAALFADRVRELASQLLDDARRYMTSCDAAVVAAVSKRDVPEWPAVELASIARTAQQLRLLVRLLGTYEGIGKFMGTLFFAYLVNIVVSHPTAENVNDWRQAYRAWIDESLKFEDAIRVELGRPPIQRIPVLPIPPSLPASMSTANHDPDSPRT
jgi:hypothetical protein